MGLSQDIQMEVSTKHITNILRVNVYVNAGSDAASTLSSLPSSFSQSASASAFAVGNSNYFGWVFGTRSLSSLEHRRLGSIGD